MLRAISAVSNLPCCSTFIDAIQRTFHSTPLLGLQLSQISLANPVGRKKKVDPAVIKMREERKRKRIEKQIKLLLKHARKPKPIDELTIDIRLWNKIDERRRPSPQLDYEELERRALLQKEWNRQKGVEARVEHRKITRTMASQRIALARLREESEDLYRAAVQLDEGLLPLEVKGPVNTPPVKGYTSPDGDYIDITRKWE